MGRKRRFVRDDGMMVCKPDKEDNTTWHAVHITQFYGIDVEPKDFWVDPKTGDRFGRPSGYCKVHTKERASKSYVPQRMKWVTPEEEEVLALADNEVVKERIGPPKGSTAITGRAPWEDED
jgi:hypothetical protein